MSSAGGSRRGRRSRTCRRVDRRSREHARGQHDERDDTPDARPRSSHRRRLRCTRRRDAPRVKTGRRRPRRCRRARARRPRVGGADAGPRATVPSSSRNRLPCHGHSMHPSLTVPSSSGPPACEHGRRARARRPGRGRRPRRRAAGVTRRGRVVRSTRWPGRSGSTRSGSSSNAVWSTAEAQCAARGGRRGSRRRSRPCCRRARRATPAAVPAAPAREPRRGEARDRGGVERGVHEPDAPLRRRSCRTSRPRRSRRSGSALSTPRPTSRCAAGAAALGRR